MIGMVDPAASSSPPSILDLASKAGWLYGVVTDDYVTGATPAPFLVEHDNRDQHEVIAGRSCKTRWTETSFWAADPNGSSIS